MKDNLLVRLRSGQELSLSQLLLLTVRLSIPAILAQVSSIVMQYIDASMVGHLGADESAAIGLVASSTWLLGGLYSALSVGFNVQVAHAIGGGDERRARSIVRQGLAIALIFSSILLVFGVSIHKILPGLLGGAAQIQEYASAYFLVFALSLPVVQLNNIAAGMLQCSGNMKVPSFLHIMMCILDVVFNALLIFPGAVYSVAGGSVYLPGAGLGVMGAALGTFLAELVTMLCMLYFLLVKSPALHLRNDEHLKFDGSQLKTALRLAVPVGCEQVIMCGAYIAATCIVAPLGVVAIAANSFSVTAESLCYMPGYGIGSAATTLIGQSVGAGRKAETRRLAWLTTGLGMSVMAISGILMYFAAPWMIGLLSPDPEIRALGTTVLRIEAFAEPMYAASIVASGVFRGAGDTLMPSCMNFVSMWLVRIPLSAYLAPRMGLRGVWIAMCIELCVRGSFFLLRLRSKKWESKLQATEKHEQEHKKES